MVTTATAILSVIFTVSTSESSMLAVDIINTSVLGGSGRVAVGESSKGSEGESGIYRGEVVLVVVTVAHCRLSWE